VLLLIFRDKKECVVQLALVVLLEVQDKKEILEVEETLASLVQKDQLDLPVLLMIALLVDKIKAQKVPEEHQETVVYQEHQGLMVPKDFEEDRDHA